MLVSGTIQIRAGNLKHWDLPFTNILSSEGMHCFVVPTFM